MMARAALAIATTVPNGVLADKACDKAYDGFRDYYTQEQLSVELFGKSFDEFVKEPGGLYALVVGMYIRRALVTESDMRDQQDVQAYTYRMLSMTHELIICGGAAPETEEQFESAKEFEELFPRRVMEMLLGYARHNPSEEVAQ